jgi:hypothetical protein
MWGPQNTRWFPTIWRAYRVRGSHGYRTVDTVPCKPIDEDEFDGDGTTKLRVRDFNPNAVRRTAQGQIEKGWKCQTVMTPSTTPAKGIYKEDIISSLPYTEVISEETFYTRDVVLDDSRLLLLRVSESSAVFRLRLLMQHFYRGLKGIAASIY